jgi:hypothetical protein
VRYAWGCVIVALQYALHVRGIVRFPYLEQKPAIEPSGHANP